MPLIPKEPKKLRSHFHLRLDASVLAELELYSRFIDSPKDYVIENLLAFAFKKDHDFQEWLAANQQAPVPEPATAARRRASTTEAA